MPLLQNVFAAFMLSLIWFKILNVCIVRSIAAKIEIDQYPLRKVLIATISTKRGRCYSRSNDFFRI